MNLGAALGMVSGGASLGQSLLGYKSSKARAGQDKAAWRQSLDLYGKFLNDPNGYLQQGEGAMRGAIGTLNRGFADAKQQLGMAGNAARQTTVTGGNQAAAGMQQSMISRGLYGTTALDNAQRGISSDVSRRLAQIDEEVGSMFAGLATQRAGAVAGAQQGLGQFFQGAYGQKQNVLENYINLLRDKPYAFSTGAYTGNALGDATKQFMQSFGMGMGAK